MGKDAKYKRTKRGLLKTKKKNEGENRGEDEIWSLARLFSYNYTLIIFVFLSNINRAKRECTIYALLNYCYYMIHNNNNSYYCV